MAAAWLLVGLALGAGVAYLLMRARVEAVTHARDELSNQFEALSSAALERNNARFLQLAEQRLKDQQAAGKTELEGQKRNVEQLVKPVQEKMAEVGRVLEKMEAERAKAYGGLNQQLTEVAETQRRLQTETTNLVTALRKPDVRGRWGEIHLRKVCEMAGMLSHCDFVEQRTVDGEERRLRPDVIVELPGGKQIVIDAKAPISAYLDAVEADDEDAREAHMDRYASHVREHASKLSQKSYFREFNSPEFVVMFLPGEVFYSAALERMPELIERSVEESVLIATPTTLIALLKAVRYGWRQERMAESAEEVQKLGGQLYERVALLSRRLVTLGKRLNASVNAYNDVATTVESRLLKSARKLREHGAAGDDVELEEPGPLDIRARRIEAEEAQDDDPDEPRALPAGEDLL